MARQLRSACFLRPMHAAAATFICMHTMSLSPIELCMVRLDLAISIAVVGYT